MVDNVNPTSQFHPYQPETSIPQTGHTNTGGGLSGMLSKAGIDPSKMGALGNSLKNVNLSNVRGMARNNGGMVLGGLAALVIGAGLMRRRSTR